MKTKSLQIILIVLIPAIALLACKQNEENKKRQAEITIPE